MPEIIHVSSPSEYPPELNWKDTRIAPAPHGGRVSGGATIQPPATHPENEYLLQELEAHAVHFIRKGLNVVLLGADGEVLETKDSFGSPVRYFNAGASEKVRCTPGVRSIGIMAETLVRVRGPWAAMRLNKPVFADTLLIVHAENDVTRFFEGGASLLSLGSRYATYDGWNCDVHLVSHVDVFNADFREPKRDRILATCPDFIVDALMRGGSV